ncbi:hypothetical protein AX15_003593 [Amanita polypyramis BW_CC]|nr:hypothetical protein AX15_003593 [Amanita polypyramis BW_CC]
MLAGSWALTRTPWLSLRCSAQATRARSYSSIAGVFHGSRLQSHTHYSTECTEDVLLPDVAAKKETSDPPTQVFEEYADEYTSVAFTSKPPRPSVMEIIDRTLPPTLPRPTTDATSIFEDQSSEYDTVSPTSSESRHSLDDVLLKLVAVGEYDEVYSILLEAKQLGRRIRVHSAYEAAAIVALDSMPISSSPRALSEQVDRFDTFFSLIPPSRVADGGRTFKGIRKRILNTPLINLDLVIRFSLILIRKGYMGLVQKYTVPIIARFAPSEVCLQFVDDGIGANKHYWLSKLPPDERNATIKSWNLRSTTIHWLAFSGRMNEVIALLPRNGSLMDGFRLSQKTHALLRFRLDHSSSPERHELINYVDSLLRSDLTDKRLVGGAELLSESSTSCQAVPKTLVPDPPMRAGSSAFAELENSDKIIEIDQPSPYLPGTLAASLRRLKNAYVFSASPRNLFTAPPPLVEVLSFFVSYLINSADKNGRGIDLLRRRVFKLGPGPGSHFLFAEMLYYFRAGLPKLVIETYVDHFYISAVPREDILAHYHELRNLRMAKYESATDSINMELPFRIGLSRMGSEPSTIRLWPATSHIALVWNALVMLAPDDSTVLQLYQKLLQIASEGFSSFSTPSQFEQSYSTALVPPSTWSAKVPAAAFTPFLRRILKSSNLSTATSLGASLLGDMVHAGIEPNVHHMTEIVQFYAQRGDSRRALMIMEQMEGGEEKREKFNGSSTDSSVSSDQLATFPAPDVVFYCALLRAFIRTRNLDDAEKVATRIERRRQLASARKDLSSEQLEAVNLLWEDLAELREAKKREPPLSAGA